VVLRGAVVGIDRAVGSRCVVGRTQAQLNVFLIILPRNTRCVELGREVWSIENIVIGGSRLSIGVDIKIRSGFCPDVVGLGGMNAFTRIEIGRCIRNLRGVWMARRHETVDLRRGGGPANLPWTV